MGFNRFSRNGDALYALVGTSRRGKVRMFWFTHWMQLKVLNYRDSIAGETH